MSRKRYYIPGIDQIYQMQETPASKERTDFMRFVITTAVAAISAVAAIVAAVISIITYMSI